MSKKKNTAFPDFNKWYLETMIKAPKESVLGRVRTLWWPSFIAKLKNSTSIGFMDSLDIFMDKSRDKLKRMAVIYAKENAPRQRDKQMQLQNQFLKSNTGKMFERFIGLTIAAALRHFNLPYSIVPFNNEAFALIADKVKMSKEEFTVKINNCEGAESNIDSDLLLFSNDAPDKFVVMISVKSTLKDRFHNVPFWNLLRRCSVSDDFPEIVPTNKTLLRNVYYIAICTDLAEEQPDFASEEGPRNLLQLDASLLDGAFVTASKAKGLNNTLDCFGIKRPYAFNPLTSFINYLAKRSGIEVLPVQ